MANSALLKAWALLEKFHKNLPLGDVIEPDVSEYHDILRKLEKETGETLDDFLIPDSRLQREITASSEPSVFNDYDDSVVYSQHRLCKREFFLMRLEAAMTYFRYLMPEEEKRRIGF